MKVRLLLLSSWSFFLVGYLAYQILILTDDEHKRIYTNWVQTSYQLTKYQIFWKKWYASNHRNGLYRENAWQA